ncbi:hypothetical protein [Thiolapillus sp.]
MNITAEQDGFQDNDAPVRICLRGIEGLGRKSLAFLFSTQANRRLELVDEHPDAITIIDVDDYRGKAAWKEIQSREPAGRPTILLGLDAVAQQGAVALQKPFRTKDILAAIDSLLKARKPEPEPAAARQDSPKRVQDATTRVEGTGRRPRLSAHAATSLNERELHAFVGSAADVDLDDPAARASIEYSPDRFLAHRLGDLVLNATREDKYLRLSCCDAEFIVDPKKRCIHTDVGESSLRSLGALPMAGEPARRQKLSTFPDESESQKWQCFSWEAFIWRMALACSRGRLPEGTNLDQRYQLKRWPNLTRLMLFPHATRISAAWVAAPLSLKEILNRLSLPQRYVFAFFSAASAAGLLVDAATHPPADTMENTSKQQPRQRRGLFRRLLKTLYKKQGDHRA